MKLHLYEGEADASRKMSATLAWALFSLVFRSSESPGRLGVNHSEAQATHQRFLAPQHAIKKKSRSFQKECQSPAGRDQMLSAPKLV